MSTRNQREAISVDAAMKRAGESAFQNAGRGRALGGVGLEQEYFVIRIDESGRPAGRVALGGEDGVYAALDRLAERQPELWQKTGEFPGPWSYLLPQGGSLTFEPGGQIEHSAAVHRTAQEALVDVCRMHGALVGAMRGLGAVLVSSGLDVWHDIADVPLQLAADRYVMMTKFFDRRGEWGRLMMRHTGSLQVNLDHGPEGVWQERWLLSNLVSPVVLATFANSPGDEGLSMRGLAWQRLDPTRTGFPELLVSGASDDPRVQWGKAALDADIMLIRRGRETWYAGRPGWTFRDWIEQGHAELGWPTQDDLDYHLTTLFLEVRPKGFLEMRSCESLPAPWRAAPVVLLTALIYDDRARRRALDLLYDCRERLPELWARAAVHGLHDDELARLAEPLWEIALDGAGRFSEDFFGAQPLWVARRFIETMTAQGRMPADVLLELADDERASLQWAAGFGWRGSEQPLPEPVP